MRFGCTHTPSNPKREQAGNRSWSRQGLAGMMRLSFGKNVGTAARVQRGQTVISIKTEPEHYQAARMLSERPDANSQPLVQPRLAKGSEHLKGLV